MKDYIKEIKSHFESVSIQNDDEHGLAESVKEALDNNDEKQLIKLIEKWDKVISKGFADGYEFLPEVTEFVSFAMKKIDENK